MNFAGLLFLLCLHLLSGLGLIRLFRIRLQAPMRLSLGLALGIAVASLVPFALELAHVPLTAVSCGVALGLVALLCAIPLLMTLPGAFREGLKLPVLKLQIAEWPFVAAIACLLALSLWQSFYWPVLPRDMLSGPEAIAEYAIREKTMINSVFSVNLETTNNHLKSPYIASLQVLYKLYVQPFGQMWVSLLAVSFTTFLYQMLRSRLHPLFAGIFVLLFLATPELFAYTYMALFDYSNMVFFFAGCYFLQAWTENEELPVFLFSGLLFGLATYIRSETLVLVLMLLPAVGYVQVKNKAGLLRTATYLALLPLCAAIFYLLCIEVYVKQYLPVSFNVSQELNKHLADLGPFWKRLSEMNSAFIFGSASIPYWGFTMYLLILLPVIDLLCYRKLQPGAKFWLYAALVVYIGLPLLGYLLPLFDLRNTTKRGLFKLFPLLMAALQYNTLLQRLSARLEQWSRRTAPGTLTSVVPGGRRGARSPGGKRAGTSL